MGAKLPWLTPITRGQTGFRELAGGKSLGWQHQR